MEYELTRSKRKTLCIAVSKEGKLIVRAPLRLPVRAIEAFLAEKSDWIREKMALHRQISDEKIKFQLAEGSLLPFLGKEYPIRIGRDALLIEEEILLPGNDLYKEAEAFYRQEARRLLPRKSSFLGRKNGAYTAKYFCYRSQNPLGILLRQGKFEFFLAVDACPPRSC